MHTGNACNVGNAGNIGNAFFPSAFPCTYVFWINVLASLTYTTSIWIGYSAMCVVSAFKIQPLYSKYIPVFKLVMCTFSTCTCAFANISFRFMIYEDK